MIYSFTNRRRAKDAIMLLADKYGLDESGKIAVYIKDGMVYVGIDDGSKIHDLDAIMHYAIITNIESERDFFAGGHVGEVYRGMGIRKFRV